MKCIFTKQITYYEVHSSTVIPLEIFRNNFIIKVTLTLYKHDISVRAPTTRAL